MAAARLVLVVVATLVLSSLIATLPRAQLTVSTAENQWWFQTGVGAINSRLNTGGNVTIQTVLQPVYTNTAYWIGEYVGSGAFIQVGYTELTLHPNLTMVAYPFVDIFSNQQEEIASPVYTNTTLALGSWHTYSMISRDGQWSFYMDNRKLVSYSYSFLGGPQANTSGPQTIMAIAEDTGTNTSSDFINPVTFANFTYQVAGHWHRVGIATAIASMGVGSTSYNGSWPYGIKVDNSSSFQAGSGLPIVPDGQVLWNELQYNVHVYSPVADVTGSGQYAYGQLVH